MCGGQRPTPSAGPYFLCLRQGFIVTVDVKVAGHEFPDISLLLSPILGCLVFVGVQRI